MCPQIPERSPDRRCARIADRQFGVLSRQQALTAGATPDVIRYRLRTGRWETILPAVYRICGSPPSPLQRVLGTCLWGGPGAAAVGRCAAAVWELEGGLWTPVEVSAPRRLKPRTSAIRTHRISTYGPDDLIWLGAVPVTSSVRTLIDLASRVDETPVEIALDQLLRRGRLVLPRLLRRLDELAAARLPGLRVLRELAEIRRRAGPGTESELETLVRRWLRTFGFPQPVFQYWVTLPDYGPARLDFAYPDLKIGIEADSYKWHSGRRAFERDRARISEFASLGWLIIQTTRQEIKRSPAAVATRLRRARARRLGNGG